MEIARFNFEDAKKLLPLVNGDNKEILNKLKTDPKKLVQQHFERQGYLFADGILQTIVSKKTVGPLIIYKTKKIARDEINFVVYDGEYYSHGETLEQAKESLIYKISNRDTTPYKSWELNDTKTKEELIKAYRVITGACEFGTKSFIINKLKQKQKKYTIQEIIDLTKNQFGNETFIHFFCK